jgi:hypothetical protein
MNAPGNSMDGAALRVRNVFASQRAAFEADPYPLADRRREKIKALKRQISRYQDLLADAMSKDFGFRAPAESKMLDLLGSMLEANHAIAHLKRWMKPSRRATELLFLTNSLSVTYQPKGRCHRALEFSDLSRCRSTHRGSCGWQSSDDQDVRDHASHQRCIEALAWRNLPGG